MKPYYQESGITIYHGDCREVLPTLAADAMIADVPYGIGLRNGDVDGHRSDRSFEVCGDLDNEIALACIDWAAAQKIVSIVFASPWKPWPGDARNMIVWDKGGAVGGGGDISTCLKRSWELIQVYRNGPMNGRRIESVWRYPITPKDTKLHICAKPISLMRALICRFTNPVDRIVDPVCGSGPTLVAAKLEGRRAIGIEIEERYCEISANRLKQGVLFPAEAPALPPK